MTAKFILPLFVLSCLCLPLRSGADEAAPASAPGAGQNAGQNGGGRRGGQFLERLREQYPQEVAEIEKLRQSDPEAAGTKMRELMDKAGFSRARGRGGRRNATAESAAEPDEAVLNTLKEKYPEEFARYEELKKTDPARAREKLRELLTKAGLPRPAAGNGAKTYLRDRTRNEIERVERELRQRDPEAYRRLETLRESDPDAARREFRRMAAESGLVKRHAVDHIQYEYTPPAAANGNTNGSNGRFGGFPPHGFMPMWGGGGSMQQGGNRRGR